LSEAVLGSGEDSPDLRAESGGRDGGEDAEGQQEERGDAVEATFEGRERHLTHLWFGSLGNPGGAGLSVWTLFR